MKTLSHIFLLFVAFITTRVHSVNAQIKSEPTLKFKTLSELPYSLEWPATVTDGKYIYAINGYANYDYSPYVLRYDPQFDKWQIINKKAGYKLQASAAYMPANGHAYVFGGTEPAGRMLFQGVQSLDVNTGEVKGLDAHNPMASAYGYAAVWNNLIYIFGGTEVGNQTTSSLYSFDPQTLKFTKLAKMPETLQTAGTIVNGMLYTFGGYDSFLQRPSNSINAYNIKMDTWSTVGTLPQPIRANNVVAYGDLIFVVSDYVEESFLGYYDTRNNTFTKINSNMGGHRGGGVAIINNILYVFGGKTYPNLGSGGIISVQAADLSQLVVPAVSAIK